jgi:prepilin peptidase CpaA
MEVFSFLQTQHLIAILVAMIAMITDMNRGRIYNWLTFPGILVGWILGFYFHGWSGLGYSIAATFAGIILYLPAAALGLIGMGDVKLLGALGALGGTNFVFTVFLYTSALGIPHAILVQMLNYGRNAFSMLLTSFSTRIFLEKTIQRENANLVSSGKYRFLLGIDIFIAVIAASFHTIVLKY